jgi:hypothetical protein
MIRFVSRTCTVAVLVLMTCAPARAWAQADTSVSAVDIQRLQDRVFSLSSDLSRMRSRDASLASRLEGDLDQLRDEVVYLKVKLRKEGRVARAEYTDLRDRLDTLGSRIRGDAPAISSSSSSSSGRTVPPLEPDPSGTTAARGSGSGTGAGYGAGSGSGAGGTVNAGPTVTDQNRPPRSTNSRQVSHEVPVGTELDVRLQTPLSSETAQVEDRFEATTLVDLIQGDQVLVPAGSVVRGVVASVKKAGRIERRGAMTLSFDQLAIGAREYPIRATVTQALESGVRGEVGKIGAGAGVGAIIGGILGGFKGALAGILIGGGGTIAATEGTDVRLDTGTVLRIRFDAPVLLEESSSRR